MKRNTAIRRLIDMSCGTLYVHDQAIDHSTLAYYMFLNVKDKNTFQKI